MIFLDTETIGLTGPAMLIQYAVDDGSVIVHDVWGEPVLETLQLIDGIACGRWGPVVGFNLTFDWFHLSKLWNVLWDWREGWPEPEAIFQREQITEEAKALKPAAGVCDLMLVARRGPYQATMARDDVRIRRVPRALALPLAAELEARVKLPEIYFHRATGERWQMLEYDPPEADFMDVVLRFGASTSLDALARDALGVPKLDFPVPKELTPKDLELEHRPHSGRWPEVWQAHRDLWRSERALAYARRDVELTRDLWRKLGSPAAGDDDSELACCVGTSRWHGWRLDLPRLEERRAEAALAKEKAPRAPAAVRTLLEAAMSPMERLALPDTRKATLHAIAKWEGHEAARRALAVIAARTAEKTENLCGKLLEAGRAHFDFKVIGTLSGRMAGAGGINPQGINQELRNCFPLADEGEALSGGDFESFEVSLAAAAYDDPQLTEDLRTGRKIHALFGEELYGDLTYDDILATGKLPAELNLYHKAKTGFFTVLYGGTEERLATATGIEIEEATQGLERFFKRYPKVREARQAVFERFCSMRQPGGIGTAVEWHEPADHVESLLDFRRYYTLENEICRTLFELAERPPKDLHLNVKVRRRDRLQTAGGATRSALYACAFGIQAANMRSAANHVIQSTGAEITKKLQRRLWDLQPVGIREFQVRPLNVHDEVMVAHDPALGSQLETVMNEVLEEYRPTVPLIGISWRRGMATWAEKG